MKHLSPETREVAGCTYVCYISYTTGARCYRCTALKLGTGYGECLEMEPKVYPDDRIGGSSRDDVMCFSLSIVAGESEKNGRLVDNPHVRTLIVSKIVSFVFQVPICWSIFDLLSVEQRRPGRGR